VSRVDADGIYASGVGEEEMIRIDKCVKDPTCVVVSFDGFMNIMTEEDQIYFINWMKKEKPGLVK
jgi:hypothetical protein